MQQIFIHYKPKKNSYTQKKNFSPKTSLSKTGSPTLLKCSQSFLSFSSKTQSILSLFQNMFMPKVLSSTPLLITTYTATIGCSAFFSFFDWPTLFISWFCSNPNPIPNASNSFLRSVLCSLSLSLSLWPSFSLSDSSFYSPLLVSSPLRNLP